MCQVTYFMEIILICTATVWNTGLAKRFTQLVNMLFNEVIGEKEKCLIFKPNELSGKPVVSIILITHTHTHTHTRRNRSLEMLSVCQRPHSTDGGMCAGFQIHAWFISEIHTHYHYAILFWQAHTYYSLPLSFLFFCTGNIHSMPQLPLWYKLLIAV